MPNETNERERELLTRREAILRVSALLGGVALVGQGAMLAGCERSEPQAKKSAAEEGFTQQDVALLDEVAETILPATETPGAKAAGVGPFIALMVTDCYADREQRVFHDGLATLDDRCRDMHGTSFLEAAPDQRLSLVEALDVEAKRHMDALRGGEPAHWFRMMKELTLLGFFTSEIGYKQVLDYVETPGRYDPCVPYEPGDKVQASHA